MTVDSRIWIERQGIASRMLVDISNRYPNFEECSWMLVKRANAILEIYGSKA